MISELINKLEGNIKEAIARDTPLTAKPTIGRNFQKNRLANIGNTILADIKLLQKRVSDADDEKAEKLANQLSASTDKTEMLKILSALKCIQLKTPRKEEIKMDLPNLPADIKSEIEADVKEIRKCYSSGCYRSAVILCGRMLETALHRKYYETTGQDILEKNPGIGLGNHIAKLNEKGVELDPGLSQQIHLVNQVRIFSVHKKQRTF